MAEKKLSRSKLINALKGQLKVFEGGDGDISKINNELFDLAEEYGFTSDHGEGFSEKYCNGDGVPTNDMDAFKKVLNGCRSWKDLGSLYFSYWREVTHFDEYDDPFSEENAGIFKAIIERLLSVIEKKGE